MSSVSVDNLVSLKAVSAASPKLRWVVSERAWFGSDPASTSAADNVNVISPNSGVGRWFRQYAVAPVSTILWTTLTASTTLAPDAGYIIDLTSTSGNVDLALPTGAAIGTTIYLIYSGVTDLLKKAIVRRGPYLINGTAWDYQFYQERQQVQLRYTGPANGWVVTTEGRFDRFQPAVIFAKPSTTTVPQNGILQYLGSEMGTASYSAPIAPQAPRPRRISFVTLSGWGGSSFWIMDKNVAGSSTFYSNSGAIAQNSLGILFYNWSTNQPIQVKLESIFIQWGNSASYRPDALSIRAAKDFGPLISYPSIGNIVDANGVASINSPDSRVIVSPSWVAVANLSGVSQNYTGNYYGNTAASLSRVYDTPSPDFYPLYWIDALTAGFRGSTPPSMEIRQIEFYGEVIGS
ncbi:hypothetical protein [Chroococcidiopsis sp.]|uniref:hypothetical protein n=1 Tax=Chroococcidiopsis sp. TaxID=3088168 RepID=UPI003F2E9AA6